MFDNRSPDRGDRSTDLPVVEAETGISAHPIVGVHDHLQHVLLEIVPYVFGTGIGIAVPKCLFFIPFFEQFADDAPGKSIRFCTETDTVWRPQSPFRILGLW